MAKTVVHDALNGLVRDLQATHGTNLASVVLYGSAAAGDHIELRSDYNLLITLRRITPEDLRLAQAPMREWRRLGHPLPVYFTAEELSDAATVGCKPETSNGIRASQQVDSAPPDVYPRFRFYREVMRLDER